VLMLAEDTDEGGATVELELIGDGEPEGPLLDAEEAGATGLLLLIGGKGLLGLGVGATGAGEEDTAALPVGDGTEEVELATDCVEGGTGAGGDEATITLPVGDTTGVLLAADVVELAASGVERGDGTGKVGAGGRGVQFPEISYGFCLHLKSWQQFSLHR
jgi:hypothetical protein